MTENNFSETQQHTAPILTLHPEQEARQAVEKAVDMLEDLKKQVLEANLRHLGLDQGWLEKELHGQGIASCEEVYLMTVDENRNVFLTRKERQE